MKITTTAHTQLKVTAKQETSYLSFLAESVFVSGNSDAALKIKYTAYTCSTLFCHTGFYVAIFQRLVF